MNDRTENAVNLARILTGRAPKEPRNIAADVSDLQAAARSLHRISERQCCEDLGCRKCDGTGYTSDAASPHVEYHPAVTRTTCKACAGTGYTTGKRESRIVERVRSLARAYRLRVYEQTDPRGWPLYLIPEESGPRTEDASWYSSRGFGVCCQ